MLPGMSSGMPWLSYAGVAPLRCQYLLASLLDEVVRDVPEERRAVHAEVAAEHVGGGALHRDVVDGGVLEHGLLEGEVEPAQAGARLDEQHVVAGPRAAGVRLARRADAVEECMCAPTAPRPREPKCAMT
jgi:hypothetical protein